MTDVAVVEPLPDIHGDPETVLWEVREDIKAIRAEIDSLKEVLSAIGPIVAAISSELESKGPFGAIASVTKAMMGQ